jgi:hypothetical protein
MEHYVDRSAIFAPSPTRKITNALPRGVFLMELEDGEDTIGDSVPDLEISLHALTSLGSTGSMMLQVKVTVGGVQLKALVDTGSTHTFIHSEAVDHLGLPVSPRDG